MSNFTTICGNKRGTRFPHSPKLTERDKRDNTCDMAIIGTSINERYRSRRAMRILCLSGIYDLATPMQHAPQGRVQGTTTGSGKSESFELSRCRLQNEILRLINFEIFGNPIEL